MSTASGQSDDKVTGQDKKSSLAEGYVLSMQDSISSKKCLISSSSVRDGIDNTFTEKKN